MSNTYTINEFNEVVKYVSWRRDTDASNRREPTEYEIQLIEELKELEKENKELKKLIKNLYLTLDTKER